MDKEDKIAKLKEFMKEEYGVTPDNIDEKLEELKKKLFKDTGFEDSDIHKER